MAYDRPAEVFPPGEYIRDELEARGWSQSDLAEILGRPPRLVSELIAGKRSVTPETARGLAEAFGTSAETWMNMESAFQLWKLDAPTDAVSRRAKLYAKAPIKEMIRRHWIEATDNVEVLERQILDFFEVESLDDEFVCDKVIAARKSSDYGSTTTIDEAWFRRARILASAVSVKKVSPPTWETFVTQMRPLIANVEDVRRLPKALADIGIRFLVVAPLTGSKVDGVCFWLDDHSPVIAVSLRSDMIDSLWFTVWHEGAHVARRDGMREAPQLDIDIVGPSSTKRDDLPESEKEVNRMAGNGLVAKAELDNFILRHKPMFYRDKVEGFAKRLGVHPGIVNGQLHHHAGLDWKFNREFHAKVRQDVIQSALTDGFGLTPPTLLPKGDVAP